MMIREWVLPGLLKTGPVCEQVWAVQDGVVNFFVVRGPAGFICIDAGWRARGIEHGFAALGLDWHAVAAVFLTHRHWDHARGATCFPDARIYALGEHDLAQSGAQPPTPRRFMPLRDDETLNVADLTVRVLATPGHTPDSASYIVADRFLFTGDALRLRRGKVAAYPTKFSHSRAAAQASIRRLARLTGLERLFTAHTGSTAAVAEAFADWR